MDKRDIFRIYKALSGIRKGIYWRNVDALDRIKDNIAINKFLRLFLEFQEESSSTTEIFIFVTVVFLTLLQLFPLYQINFNLYILLCCYAFLTAVITINHIIKKRRKSRQLVSLEKEFSSRLESHEKELIAAGLKDDIIGYLSELKLMDEMKVGYNEMFSNGEIEEAEAKEELSSIEEVRKDLLQIINEKRLKLKEIKGAANK